MIKSAFSSYIMWLVFLIEKRRVLCNPSSEFNYLFPFVKILDGINRRVLKWYKQKYRSSLFSSFDFFFSFFGKQPSIFLLMSLSSTVFLSFFYPYAAPFWFHFRHLLLCMGHSYIYITFLLTRLPLTLFAFFET